MRSALYPLGMIELDDLAAALLRHLSGRFVFDLEHVADDVRINDPDGAGAPLTFSLDDGLLRLRAGANYRSLEPLEDDDAEGYLAYGVWMASNFMAGFTETPISRGKRSRTMVVGPGFAPSTVVQGFGWLLFRGRGSKTRHEWSAYRARPGTGITATAPCVTAGAHVRLGRATASALYEFDLEDGRHVSLHDATLLQVEEAPGSLTLHLDHAAGLFVYDFALTGWITRETSADYGGIGELIGALDWDEGITYWVETPSLNWRFFATSLTITQSS